MSPFCHESICNFHYRSGKLKSSTNAIDLGMIILNSKTSMKNVSIKWKVIPGLIHLLNSQNRLPEAISVLFELKELSETNTDRSGLIWFYALCLDIHLDTGYSIISYKNCLKFHTDELESNKHFINDLNSIRRFYANLLLICVRRENWESGKFWENEFNEFFALLPEDLNVNVLTALRALEGKLLEFIYAIESRSLYMIISLQKRIENLIKGIRSCRTMDSSLRIHFTMLRIYYKQIRKFNEGNISKMIKLLKRAKAHSFLLYKDILTHNIRVSYLLIELLIKVELFLFFRIGNMSFHRLIKLFGKNMLHQKICTAGKIMKMIKKFIHFHYR